MLASNSKQNKALNLRLVLSQVATCSPISRADIAKKTGLTKQTITNMVDELLAAQLVTETGIRKKGGVGKPSKMLALSGKHSVCIGIRIFADRCCVGLFDLLNNFVDTAEAVREPSLVSQLSNMVSDLAARNKLADHTLLALGVCFVEQFDEQYPDHQSKHAMIQELANETSQPVVIETTAAACAAFHMLHGEAKSLDSFVYIHLGSQIESATVFGRKIMLGHNQITGAIGEIFVTPETNNDDGELGRLNQFASLSALRQHLGASNVNQEQLEDLIQMSSQKFEQWLDLAAEPMRIAIHMLESVMNCQTVIFGGDLAPELIDKLLVKLRPLIPSIAQYGERTVPRIIKTPHIQRIALSGAATLPLHCAVELQGNSMLALPELSELTAKQNLLFNAGQAPQ